MVNTIFIFCFIVADVDVVVVLVATIVASFVCCRRVVVKGFVVVVVCVCYVDVAVVDNGG